MPRKRQSRAAEAESPRSRTAPKARPQESPAALAGRPSALVDTRTIYCGDCLDQFRKLPDGCVDLIYIDPPFNSNRNYEVFWGGQSEPRAQASGFSAQTENRHARTQAYIDYMRPRCARGRLMLRREALPRSPSRPAPIQCTGNRARRGRSDAHRLLFEPFAYPLARSDNGQAQIPNAGRTSPLRVPGAR